MADEVPDTTMEEETLRTNISWLPMAPENTVPLMALSVCHVNIDTGCDFHVTQKMREYMNDWSDPAPVHCKRNQSKQPTPVVHADRLGMEFPCETFR